MASMLTITPQELTETYNKKKNCYSLLTALLFSVSEVIENCMLIILHNFTCFNFRSPRELYGDFTTEPDVFNPDIPAKTPRKQKHKKVIFY